MLKFDKATIHNFSLEQEFITLFKSKNLLLYLKAIIDHFIQR